MCNALKLNVKSVSLRKMVHRTENLHNRASTDGRAVASDGDVAFSGPLEIGQLRNVGRDPARLVASVASA